MKVLHTSDWHLGKKLEGYSRIDEQQNFIDEIIHIANEKMVDMAIIAGDIYDSPNPSFQAEKLYFDAIKRLSNMGKRPVIVISGNHDSAEKLLASHTLSKEFGVITFGHIWEEKELGRYGSFEVSESYKGAIVIKIGEKEVFVNAMPYPSEKEISENIGEYENYSECLGKILLETHKNNVNNLPSIIISHLFTIGSHKDGSERDIELGGSLAFDLNYMPKADYVALGHIHKPMVFKDKNCVYSGSPMEFRISENKFDKKVFIKDLYSGTLEEIPLKIHKEIKAYTLFSIEEALLKSAELMDKNEWIYFFIETDRPLRNKETKELKRNKNIIEIIPKINWQDQDDYIIEEYNEENVKEAFVNFYKKNRNIDIPQEVYDAFTSIVEGSEDETN